MHEPTDVRPRAILALEDGTVFEGRSFGRVGEVTGEGGDRRVILTVGEPVLIHLFNLDEQLDWTMEGEWAFGQPTGQGGDEYSFGRSVGGT